MTLGLKTETSQTFFSFPFVMDNKNFQMFLNCFPPPIVVNDKKFYRYYDKQNPEQDKVYDEKFDAAATIWMHWVLYDLLTSKSFEEIQERCRCPIFDYCKYRELINNDYNCTRTPWLNIKENQESICPYGMATHSFGLFQNNLDINVGR